MFKMKSIVMTLAIISVVVFSMTMMRIQKNNTVEQHKLLTTTYAYAGTDNLPTEVNTYERKNQNPCKGKACGCGSLPACNSIDEKTGVSAPKNLTKAYFSCDEDPRKYDKLPVSRALVDKQLSCVFRVTGANVSNYTLITTRSSSVNLDYFHKNATPKTNYCTPDSKVSCRVAYFYPNQQKKMQVYSMAQLVKTHLPIGACHIAKGSQIVKKLPFDSCYQKDIILP